MSPITRIHLALVYVKNCIVLGVLSPLMKAKTRRAEKSKADENNEVDEEIITLADIAGYDSAKQYLESVASSLKNRDTANADVPSCLLLYGPPGTGKTMMAAAVAGSADVPFFAVSAASFVSKYAGYGSASVRFLLKQARENAPCIVFVDDLDALCEARFGDEREYRSTLNALLSELDGINGSFGILVLAATNRIGDLNPDLMRAGRFDHKIEIPLPGYDDRLAILEHCCKDRALDRSVDLKRLAMDTEGKSGADLSAIINEAVLITASCGRTVITKDDIDQATLRTQDGV